MTNNFDKFQFPHIFDVQTGYHTNHFQIHETVEHTFDERNQHKVLNSGHGQGNDQRTEDQVRSDLNFSIEDLLSKISKATADFQEAPYYKPQPQKQSTLNNSFKISNLSASTQSNSNQQISDPYIQKYESYVEINKKRQSEPQKDSFTNNDRLRGGIAQKHNSVYYGFGEGRIIDKKNEQGRDWDNILKNETSNGGFIQPSNNFNSVYKPDVKSEPMVEWGRSSSRNQPASFTQIITQTQHANEWGRNSSRNQTQIPHHQPESVSQWGRLSSKNQIKNQPQHEFKPTQPVSEWGRNSSRNQPKIEPINSWSANSSQVLDGIKQHKSSESIPEWGRNSLKNSIKTQPLQQWKKAESSPNQWGRNSSRNQSNTENSHYEWKSSELIPEWGRNSSKNQPKWTGQTQEWNSTNQKIQPTSESYNEIIRSASKQQISRQPTVQVKIQPVKKEPFQQITPPEQNSPKRQIQALLNPFQSSGFGKSNNQMLKKPEKNKFIAASIIIEDNQSRQCQQIPIEKDKKVNTLFDGRKIRQVAASTIMDSPDKMKKKKTNNPFSQIVEAKNADSILLPNKELTTDIQYNEGPIIKINKVRKSEITEDKQGPKLTIQDFHLGQQLGSGKFGDVYQAIHKATGALYAIKKIFKSTIEEYNMIEQFTRQLKIHYSLNYPNIIKLYTHFDDEYHIFLVMEYGEGGMLMEKVKNGEKFTSVIVEQMLRAVQYIHNKKIAHRDIKPENIVLMFGDTAKMCDFGWSRFFDSDMKKTFCGTLDYVSPQMKDKGEYSLKIDIWSLGVLTFELLCGYAPFKDQITNWKRKGGNLNKAWNWNILYPPEISSVAQSFMRNLLKENPQQRANIRFCLNHLFIRKFNQMNFDEEEDRRFKEIAFILKEEN